MIARLPQACGTRRSRKRAVLHNKRKNCLNGGVSGMSQRPGVEEESVKQGTGTSCDVGSSLSPARSTSHFLSRTPASLESDTPTVWPQQPDVSHHTGRWSCYRKTSDFASSRWLF
ncbi:uncharacterized protein LOC129012209 [Pongo pygmaeus]|uniref:uncharacterized protein LOC100937451 n=1 Tax=Pongo abelii TaxID=9601 RepID=UPI000273DAE5|nr:uncharacterized protein LOC100937451 [Pongo abelii]XP_054303640.1 uncharacterized protein LOC129012209 [Pongo pygmaeus]